MIPITVSILLLGASKVRLIDMLPLELDEEMNEILFECMLRDPFFDPMSYECQSFALQILLAREAVKQRQTTQVKYEVVSSAPYVDEGLEQEIEHTKDAYAIRDLLSLVSMKVPLVVIDTWSEKELHLVVLWASATHLRASDNYDVKVPKMPKVLKPYKNK